MGYSRHLSVQDRYRLVGRPGALWPLRTASATQAGADAVLSVEELRAELGLFGDTSQDALVVRARDAAVGTVERILGYPIMPKSVTEYFAGWASRLLLSIRGGSGHAVNYQAQAGQQSALASSAWHLDESDHVPALAFQPVPVHELSEVVAGPVSVAYQHSPAQDFQFAAVRQSVVMLVQACYFNRMGQGIPEMAMMAARSQLDPFRRSL